MRTWRRLQQLGAIPIKQAVYALPDTPHTREDFEWLKTEVKASGGEASVFAANHVVSPAAAANRAPCNHAPRLTARSPASC